MGNVSQRLAALEKATGAGDAAECACTGGPRGTGWRVMFEEPGSGQTDPVAVCVQCGKERPMIRVVYTDDWREAGDSEGGAEHDSAG